MLLGKSIDFFLIQFSPAISLQIAAFFARGLDRDLETPHSALVQRLDIIELSFVLGTESSLEDFVGFVELLLIAERGLPLCKEDPIIIEDLVAVFIIAISEQVGALTNWVGSVAEDQIPAISGISYVGQTVTDGNFDFGIVECSSSFWDKLATAVDNDLV